MRYGLRYAWTVLDCLLSARPWTLQPILFIVLLCFVHNYIVSDVSCNYSWDSHGLSSYFPTIQLFDRRICGSKRRDWQLKGFSLRPHHCDHKRQDMAKWCNNDKYSRCFQVLFGAVQGEDRGSNLRPGNDNLYIMFGHVSKRCVPDFSSSQVQIQRSHISSCLPVSRFSLCAANLSRPSFWRPKYLPECPEFPRMDPPLVRTDPFHWLRDDTHENDMPSERCTESWHRCF